VRRGELYRVPRPPGGDPRRSRVFLVVSRDALFASAFSTVVCVPVYSAYLGLASQVPVGEAEGLKHPSSLDCDNLTSVRRDQLRAYVGSLSDAKMREVDRALIVALQLETAFER